MVKPLFSVKLGNAIIEQIESQNPSSIFRTTNLSDSIFDAFICFIWLRFLSVRPTNVWKQANIRDSEESVADLKLVTIVVIGVPVYNFGIPPVLKARLGDIAKTGKTFSYLASGAEVF